MTKRAGIWSLALMMLVLVAPLSQAQLKLPRVSQKATVMQTVGLTDVTITYSRPGVKGRSIWGGLVPYDQVWRTGANEATTFAVSTDVMINGQKLPAGTYSLHTIPGKSEWTVIFNKVADQWGSFSYDATKDALRVKVKPEEAPFTEWLTFDIPQVGMNSANIDLRWEKVRVPLKLEVDTVGTALANSRAAVASAKADDWKIPYAAASFAFENNVATEEGSKWLDQSLKAQETATNLYLKARWQAKSGQKAAAIKTAEQALAKATAPAQAEFASEIKASIEEWKK